MEQKPKLEKIVTMPDICSQCSVCHKLIKHVYYTNMGIMGRDCFLTAIGLPRVRNSVKSSPKLPAEQYESVAESCIKQLESMTDQDWLTYLTDYYSELLSISRLGLNFIITFKNHGFERTDDFNILLFHRDHVSKLAGIPIDMMDNVMDSKYYNQYYFQSIHQTGDYIKVL